VLRAFSLFLVALLATGCGSDDDDSNEPSPTAPPAGVLRFSSERIPFTFDYPHGDLVEETCPGEPGVFARVGVARCPRLNAIKVRRTARRELEPERYLDEFERDFERTVGTVEKREERIGPLDVGVLEFEDTVERGGEMVAFTSSSYFFRGAGRTWQIECIADAEHRAQIEAACRTALESVQF
jgi:hypothetical protein